MALIHVHQKKIANLPVLTVIEQERAWRNKELLATDWVVPLTDHPERASYLTYRTKLRDWPSTDDFPETRPTL